MLRAALINVDKCFDLALRLVQKAGTLVRDRNDSRQSYLRRKGDTELYTETGKEIEILFENGIREVFPNHKFIGQESIRASDDPKIMLTDSPTWIIDPIDGTMNFIHAFPLSCISIGFMIDKEFEIGIVYCPVLDMMFTGHRGKGAFYNGHRMRVSHQKTLDKALVTTEFGSDRDPEKMQIVFSNFAKVAEVAHGIRCLGSPALNMCMIGMGVADASYEFGTHAWDVCAATVIVQEAGGVVIDPAGGEFDLMSRRFLAASCPKLATDLSQLLTQYYPEPRDD